MESNAKVQEILTQFGLDFRIEKLPMVAKQVVGKVSETIINENGIEEVVERLSYKDVPTDYFGLLNTKSGNIINQVKAGYEVSQNDEILELVLEGMKPFGDQLSVTKAGSLNDGRKTYVQLGIEGFSKIGSETIKRYVTIIDSNDGTTSLSVGLGELVMSCSNQFFKFYKDGQSKYRHTASLRQRVMELPYLIEKTLAESLKLNEVYGRFQSTKVTRKLADDMVKHLLGYDKLMSVRKESDLSVRSLNVMDDLYGHLEKEMNQKGENLFGLFSGVTSWTTKDKSCPRRENGRLESLMVGTNYRVNQDAYEFTMSKLGLVMA
jgi:hypothetical protein